MAIAGASMGLTNKMVGDIVRGDGFPEANPLNDPDWTIEDEMAEQAAEMQAEDAWLRHAENAGWADAEAQRDYEDSMGVVQFEDAFREALGEDN